MRRLTTSLCFFLPRHHGRESRTRGTAGERGGCSTPPDSDAPCAVSPTPGQGARQWTQAAPHAETSRTSGCFQLNRPHIFLRDPPRTRPFAGDDKAAGRTYFCCLSVLTFMGAPRRRPLMLFRLLARTVSCDRQLSAPELSVDPWRVAFSFLVIVVLWAAGLTAGGSTGETVSESR